MEFKTIIEEQIIVVRVESKELTDHDKREVAKLMIFAKIIKKTIDK